MQGGDEARTVFRFTPLVAPVKATVFPLMQKAELNEVGSREPAAVCGTQKRGKQVRPGFNRTVSLDTSLHCGAGNKVEAKAQQESMDGLAYH